ncbi:MAG: ABC transporter substrate-binding protein [Firmicutes bacterium]|nr:ABC transporter substrate-binding protein [Bacillota bacterium]
MKKLKLLMTAIIATTVVAGGLLLTGCRNRDTDYDFTIGILNTAQVPALEQGRRGFESRLRFLLESEGKTVQFDYRNAGGDSATQTTIANSFAAQNVDMMFTLGTGGSQAARDIASVANIPQVFGVITDPVGAGLVTPNTSGSSSAAPMETQVGLMADMVGGLSELRNVAYIYTASEDNSRATGNRLAAAGDEMGFTVTRFSINQLSDLNSIFISIAANPEIQLIYIGQDNQITNNMQMVQNLNRSSTRPLPIVVADLPIVGMGAVAALNVDFWTNGVRAADIAFRILIDGVTPGDIPFYRPVAETLSLWVNQTEAAALNFTVPTTVTNRAARTL